MSTRIIVAVLWFSVVKILFFLFLARLMHCLYFKVKSQGLRIGSVLTFNCARVHMVLCIFVYLIKYDFHFIFSPPQRFFGRRPGDQGQSDGEQITGRRQFRVQTAGSPDHHQGQTTRNTENGLFADAQTYQAHPRTISQRDQPADESHTGK